MMKKFYIIIFLLVFNMFISVCRAEENICEIVCPDKQPQITDNENFLAKISAVSFISQHIVEIAIQNGLNNELNSNIKADLEIFNLKSLKNGEFKNLSLKSKNLQYKALSLSDFQAETICPYNKVVYQNKKIYYPVELPFKFKANMTNQDILNVFNSEEFKSEILKKPVKINGLKVFEMRTPDMEIKDGLIYLTIPFKTLFGSVRIKTKAQIEVINNKIVLRNIFFNSKSNIIDDSMLTPILEGINPITFASKVLNGKYCKVNITSAKIVGDKIQTEGVFIINKNYGGENE